MCPSVYFYPSTSSSETPKLSQRITDAVKSYIYTPEEGKHVGFAGFLVVSLIVVLSFKFD